MKVKIADLQGPALDWAVAMCQGYSKWCGQTRTLQQPQIPYGWADLSDLQFSTDWNLGGPIITAPDSPIKELLRDGDEWKATADGATFTGPTMLMAALRCHVAANNPDLDEIDIPDELCEQDCAAEFAPCM